MYWQFHLTFSTIPPPITNLIVRLGKFTPWSILTSGIVPLFFMQARAGIPDQYLTFSLRLLCETKIFVFGGLSLTFLSVAALPVPLPVVSR